MASISEEQGNTIIQLLEDILWQLEHGHLERLGGIDDKIADIQFNVDRIEKDVASIQVDVAAIEASKG